VETDGSAAKDREIEDASDRLTLRVSVNSARIAVISTYDNSLETFAFNI
jgi:hypothetical protein